MSSDRYAIIGLNATVSLLTKYRITLIDKAATIEAAVNVLVKAAPPNTIKGVYIVSNTDFQTCRRSVEAVQKAGYTVVELVETLRFSISSMIYNLPLNPTNGAIIFVFVEELGEYSLTQAVAAILRKREKGWQLISADKMSLEALAEFPSVSDIVYRKDTPQGYDAVMNYIFPGRKLHRHTMDNLSFITTFFKNRMNNGSLDGHEMLPYCFYNLVVEFGDKSETITLSQDVPPFAITKAIDVGDVPSVQIRACDSDTEHNMVLVKTFKFKTTKFRTVEITVNVDRTLVPHVTLKTVAPRDSVTSQDNKVDTNGPITTVPMQMSQLKLDLPSPTTVITFTSDNRVLISADETYTGDKDILAFVRLQNGKAPEVGKSAFDALKEHPGSVFYGITRLLATDFDPDHPDPSWYFKTTRDADGKVVIRSGDDMITFPIVLFGLVVRSTLLYVQEHVESEITSLGVRLPSGCAIPDADLKDVSKRIGVELVLL